MNQARFVFAAVAFAALPPLLCASAHSADPPAPDVPPITAPAASPTPAAAAVIDPAAIALLKKAEKAIFALKTFQADCWMTQTSDPKTNGMEPQPARYEMASLAAAKPNKMRYDQWKVRGAYGSQTAAGWKRDTQIPALTIVCDGTTQWDQLDKKYWVVKHGKPVDPNYLSCTVEPWDGFWARSNSLYGDFQEYQQKPGSVLEVRAIGREVVNGVPCDKVLTHVKTVTYGVPVEYLTTWYIGIKDGLVRRKNEHINRINSARSGYTRNTIVYNVRANVPIPFPAKTFAYAPPKGVEKESERVINLPLLMAGTLAPDFSTLDKNNKAVKLSDFKGKVVVVDFWASWCGPCIASLPHTQEVTQKLQKDGVPFVLLAVDNSEDRPAFDQWVKAHEAEFNALQFVYADPKTNDISGKQYHVSGIPTQYIIDGSGIIRASFVGYDGPTDVLEKAVRAAAAAGKP